MVQVSEARALLERGPGMLEALYTDLPDMWLHAHDPGEWSAHTCLIHMVTLEDHAWAHRIRHVLEHPGSELPPIDRGGPDASRDVVEMLERFAELRAANLTELDALGVDRFYVQTLSSFDGERESRTWELLND